MRPWLRAHIAADALDEIDGAVTLVSITRRTSSKF
jgi:hypothetical protein